EDRPRAAGAHHRHLRDGVGHGVVQPRFVRTSCQPRARRARSSAAHPVGSAPRPHPHAVGRDEAPRADRQGAGARARDPVPRRAHRRRRRRAAPRHVGAGARAARGRGHHRPHHALHRRGRGDGRAHRRDQQGRAGGGRGEGDAHEEAREEGAHAPPGFSPRSASRRSELVANKAQERRKRAAVHLRCARGAHRHPRAAAPPGRARRGVQGPADAADLARGHFPGAGETMNPHFNRFAVAAIYRFEMARFRRTLWQSLAAPVITTSLYFVVFGAAIGTRMTEIEGVPYGAFIVPGLIMLALFTESLSNASFGIYLPKFTGTIYEVLSAPVWMFAFMVLTATTFCLFGFILGIWADGFDQLQFVPMLVLTPLTFLGGAF